MRNGGKAMASLITRINTGLDHFIPLSAITEVKEDSISGVCQFDGVPGYLAIEACAQLGALHVRKINDFSCHAFLMKINHFERLYPGLLNDTYRIFARLRGQSQQAFSYQMEMVNENGATTKGRFIIAVKPYDGQFDEFTLNAYYRNLFSCLRTASENY